MTASVTSDRHDDIDDVVTELSAVWHRNPQKTFMQVAARAARDSTAFIPDDTTDEEILRGLRGIGRR